MRNVVRKNYFITILYFFVAIVTFGKLPLSFFLQDEWLIIGTLLYFDKANLNWFERFFIYGQNTHSIPLTGLITNLQFELFRHNFFLYGLTAIVFHVVNTFLVYQLAFLLLKKRILAFTAGLLFLTTSISHQGFTWIATTIGTSLSAQFLLLSLIFFVRYLNQARLRILDLCLSIIFFGSALLFKETSVFGLFLFPVIWFIYRREDFHKAKMALIILLPLGFLYAVIRIINIIKISRYPTMDAAFVQPGIDVYVFRMIALPLRFISQAMLPQEIIIKISDNLMKFSYPFLYFKLEDLRPYIAQSVGADIVSYFFSILVIAISIICIHYYNKKEKHYGTVILLSLAFIALSSFPFIFVPGMAGYNSLIDGRHLYATEIFTSILLSIMIYTLYRWLPQKKLRLLIVSVIVISFLFFHMYKIRKEMNHLVDVGLMRKSILNSITRLYPRLPEKVIFYIESDKAYYGLAPDEKILPFQSGFGQTLLVWYNERGEDYPACFFHDQFLYVLKSEGYRECGGRGFGYFRNMEPLKSVVITENLKSTQIIGLRYTSSTNTLEDITESLEKTVIQ